MKDIAEQPIGIQIKYWRNQCGYTMKQLAEQCGINGKQGINAYESGVRIPSQKMLNKIAKALDCKVNLYLSKNSDNG